ncbi:molybdenum cofactor guanylyltransferase [Belliella marina]|uniref:Probable molybdenum cofactor guanylyltransferase n=1 Tax=Belliella marina TaxID=1644146 RepID=A0ABW4VTS7_9BACT
MNNNEVEVFILAGGKSSRMGQDKGLIPILGKPMVQHLIEKADQLGLHTSIISPSTEYMVFGKPLYQDIIPDQGPMGGLYTALTKAKTNKTLLLSCDIPLIPIEALRKITECHQIHEICVATIEGQTNPLLALYDIALLPQVKESILEGKLKMRRFIESNLHTPVDLDHLALNNPLVFTNFNTMQDIENLQKSYGNK